MRLRHLCAPPLRLAHRLVRAGRARPPLFRALLFHDVPLAERDKFARLVAYVAAEHGTLTPAEAVARLDHGNAAAGGEASGKTPWKVPCLFSFDDGFASNFDIAVDILGRHGIKAALFVCPGLIDLTGDAQRDAVAARVFEGRITGADLPAGQRLMTWDELGELKRLGHEIGSHGMLHRRLAGLDADCLAEEVVGSGDLLDRRLGQDTQWYAYAFGDIASIDAAAMRRIAGRYRYCRSGLRGANGAATPALALRADSAAPADPMGYQKLLFEGGLDFLYRDAGGRLDAMLPDVT